MASSFVQTDGGSGRITANFSNRRERGFINLTTILRRWLYFINLNMIGSAVKTQNNQIKYTLFQNE